jgi:hypothetical protein
MMSWWGAGCTILHAGAFRYSNLFYVAMCLFQEVVDEFIHVLSFYDCVSFSNAKVTGHQQSLVKLACRQICRMAFRE